MMTNEQLLPVIHRVMDKLMNLGGADYDSDKGADKASTAKGNIARDFGIEEWDWPQGVGLYGLYKLQSFYGDTRYLDLEQLKARPSQPEHQHHHALPGHRKPAGRFKIAGV